MSVKHPFTQAFVASLALVTVAAVIAMADEKDPKPASPAEIKLPPGWTQADLEACMLAWTPGKMHEHLAKATGVWSGKSTMWMGPGAEPIKSECVSTVTPIMDGRFIKYEMKGDMPGMGPYNGFGLYGYDNVSQEFNSTWIDNHSTGMMRGTGKLSDDGKTLTWKFTYNCPLTKKPAIMREIETITGPDTKTLETFAADPKSGQEYKMMSIEFTKKP
jgi:hypothetical protein